MTMVLTKLFGDKRRWRQYKARTRTLPADYRAAVDALERYLLWFGPGRSDAIQRMLDDLFDLFQQSAANGIPIPEIVGEEPVAFAEAFLANYSDGGWITKERKRLTSAIDRAAAQRSGDPRTVR